MRALLITAAVCLGAIRVLGLFGVFLGVHPIWLQVFKDVAHLYTGGVIGAAIACRRHAVGDHRLLVRLAVGLSVLETVCAVLSRLG